ncbi:MAG: tetratricopeptide repeat-containing diguanylate cyclase [bacterium]
MLEEKIVKLTKKLNQLKKKNSTFENTREIIDTLNDISLSCYVKQPEMAEKYALEARKEAKKIKYLQGLGSSFQYEGFSHWARGNFIKSETCYRKALDIFEKIQYKTGIANAYNNLGSVLAIQGRYEASINYFQQSSALYQNLKDEHGVASVFANMGIIYKNKKEYEMALEYQNQALKIFKKLGNRNYQAIVHNSIGGVLLAQKHYSEAIKYFRKSLRIKKKMENMQGAALSYRFIGIAYKNKGVFKKALSYCLKSYDLVKDSNRKRHIMLISHTLGEIYLGLQKYNFSEKFLLESLKTCREIGIKDEQYRICRHLSTLYEEMGNYSKALEFYKKYNSLKDEVYTTEYNDKIAYLKIDHEVEKREKEAEIQRLKNVELVREISKRKKVEKALRKSEERFKQLSIEDPLTKIFNRRYFLKSAAKIIKRAAKKSQEISLVIFDLDHFKIINDTCGHLKGDQVIKQFVKIVKQNIRPEDIFARYGGEEFILLLVNSDIKNAKRIAERIRRKTAKNNPAAVGCSVKMTLSAGISGIEEINQKSAILKKLIKIADQRLYQAKNTGRNKVVSG